MTTSIPFEVFGSKIEAKNSKGYRNRNNFLLVQVQQKKWFPFYVGPSSAIAREAVKKKFGTYKTFEPEAPVTMLLLDIECHPPLVVYETARRARCLHLLPDKDSWNVVIPQEEIIRVFLDAIKAIVTALVEFVQSEVILPEENSEAYNKIVKSTSDIDLLLARITALGEKGKEPYNLSEKDFCVDEACDREQNGKLSAHIVCPALHFFSIQHDMKHFVYYFISLKFSHMVNIPFWMKVSPPIIPIGVELDSLEYTKSSSLYFRFHDSLLNHAPWTRTCIDAAIYSNGRTLRCTGSGKEGNKRILRPFNYNGFWTSALQEMNYNIREISEASIEKATNDSRVIWMVTNLELKPRHFSSSDDGTHPIAPPWPENKPTGTHRISVCNWKNEYGNVLPFAGKTLEEKKRDKTCAFSPIWLKKYDASIHDIKKKLITRMDQLPKTGAARYIIFELLLDLHSAVSQNNSDKVLKAMKDLEEASEMAPMVIKDIPIGGSFFSDPTVRVDSSFLVRLPHCREPIALSTITTNTPIFCPIHEPSDDQHPSAYVLVDVQGRRMIGCRVCGGDGNAKIFEEVATTDDNNLSNIAKDNVTIIDEPFLGLQHLIPDVSNPCAPFAIVIRSGMGSGKTSLIKLLLNDFGETFLAEFLPFIQFDESNPLRVLATLPRAMLTEWAAIQFSLNHQYDVIRSIGAERKLNKQPSLNYNELSSALASTERLSVCFPSLPRVVSRKWDIVILDEAPMSARLLVSDLVFDIDKISSSLYNILSKCQLQLILGADLDCATLKSLLPGTDWSDPSRCKVIDNVGGKGGLQGVDSYYTRDFVKATETIINIVKRNEDVVFIPTNQKYFVYTLKDILLQYVSELEEKSILCITAMTPNHVKDALIADCKGYMKGNGFKIIIASPAFGTGFSINKGYVTMTFGFMFQYPPNTHDCVQMLARAREPTCLIVYCEDVNLGQKFKYKNRMVDGSWRVEKCIQLLESRKQTYSQVIDSILQTNADDPIAQVWQQYYSIRQAEQDVQLLVGTLMILERLVPITGKAAIPLEKHPINEFDFERYNVQEPLKLFKSTDKKQFKRDLQLIDQRRLAEIKRLDGNISYEQVKLFDFASKSIFIPTVLEDEDKSKLGLKRLDKLVLFLWNLNQPGARQFLPIQQLGEVDYSQRKGIGENLAMFSVVCIAGRVFEIVFGESLQTVLEQVVTKGSYILSWHGMGHDKGQLQAIAMELEFEANANGDSAQLLGVLKGLQTGETNQFSTHATLVTTCFRVSGLGIGWKLEAGDPPVRRTKRGKREIDITSESAKICCSRDIGARIKLGFCGLAIRMDYDRFLCHYVQTPKNVKGWWVHYLPDEAAVDKVRGGRSIRKFAI